MKRYMGEVEIATVDLAPNAKGVGMWLAPLDVIAWGLAPSVAFHCDGGIERARLVATLLLDGLPMCVGVPLFVRSMPRPRGEWPAGMPSPQPMLFRHVLKGARGARVDLALANRGRDRVRGAWHLCVAAVEPLAPFGIREVIA